MKRRLILFLGLIPAMAILLGINPSLALGAASAGLRIETNQIAAGDAVQFSITITGSTSAPQPDIKPIDGLSIQYLGPTTQFQFINGRSSSSIAHNYVLTAIKPGVYTLGPFEIRDGQDTLTTNSVQLTVIKGTTGGNQNNPSVSGDSGQSDSELYFNFSIPKSKMYLGEKIPITFRLYVGQVRLAGPIESLGFNQPEIALDQIKVAGEQQQLINGQVYRVVEITGVLSPVKTGTFTLGPAKMVLPVMVRRRSSSLFDDFLDNYIKRPVQLDSKNKPVVTILHVPESGRPANFSQGIGRFQVKVTADNKVVKQGDPITIQITVSGNGNLQSITAPVLTNTKGLKVYNAQRRETPDQEGAPPNQVTFEQVLIPLETSVKQIGPLVLWYFDPDSGQFRQAASQVIPISVKANPNFNAATVMASTGSGDEELGQDLIYIKDNLGRLRTAARPVYQELWFQLLQLLPLLGLLGAFIYRKQRDILMADTPESRALRAGNQAGRRLAKAETLKNEAKYDELLEELHLTVRQYLGEKFNLPAAGMTVKVVEALDSKGIPAAVTNDIREFFERYDYHRFTGAHLLPMDAEDFWERAVRILSALDNRKKIGIKPKTHQLGVK